MSFMPFMPSMTKKYHSEDAPPCDEHDPNIEFTCAKCKAWLARADVKEVSQQNTCS